MENFEISEEFNVKPEKLYNAWLDSKIHGQIISSKAEIDPKLGGEFDIWDGYITGKTIKLVKNKTIVQEWRTTEFPDGSENSLLELDFENTAKGTKLVMKHSKIPDGQADEYKNGWIEYYFKPMKEFFSE
jgi:activator of HSP90 ATPase